jgi:hypothetical protein
VTNYETTLARSAPARYVGHSFNCMPLGRSQKMLPGLKLRVAAGGVGVRGRVCEFPPYSKKSSYS